MSTAPPLGVIGGTSVYEFPRLEGAHEQALDTPYGAPSGPLVSGTLGGHAVVFLARHGRGHALAPHRINYRANLYALKQLGVARVLAINTVGGISAAMCPGALVLPDQIVDYTHGREASFWDIDAPGSMRHAEFGEPYTPRLRLAVLAAAARAGIALVDGGTYAATQGPRFESIAEIVRLARDGCDLVGMTGMPEAALARELAIDYACVAPVANWAAGCDGSASGLRHVPPISLDEIYAHLARATAPIAALVGALLDDSVAP